MGQNTGGGGNFGKQLRAHNSTGYCKQSNFQHANSMTKDPQRRKQEDDAAAKPTQESYPRFSMKRGWKKDLRKTKKGFDRGARNSLTSFDPRGRK